MSRATRDPVLDMLREEGAIDAEAGRIIEALEVAGLNPSAMRVWLAQARLIDWMRDERLPDALEALTTGRIDPVALNKQDALGFWGW